MEKDPQAHHVETAAVGGGNRHQRQHKHQKGMDNGAQDEKEDTPLLRMQLAPRFHQRHDQRDDEEEQGQQNGRVLHHPRNQTYRFLFVPKLVDQEYPQDDRGGQDAPKRRRGVEINEQNLASSTWTMENPIRTLT